MKDSKLLLRHAFILDLLCLLLCFALLFLGTKDIVPYWILAVGAFIALVALVTSIFLFIKARKIDKAESRRIEREILENAAKEDAVDKAIENGDITDEETDYKADDEQ
ncbi:MAG: hypothetical protein IKT03_06555 [Muribaculaceae bacterium]|nr:hypothetical protein [Muribaculaceae bacterium]